MELRMFIIAVLLFLNSSSAFCQGSTDCSSSTLVSLGTHDADNSLGDQWFRYRSNSNRRITISSLANSSEVNTFVQLYEACDGKLLKENNDANGGTRLSQLFHPIAAGTTYYIVWRGSSNNSSFQWSISEESVLMGDLCSVPNTATIGTNTVRNPITSSETVEWFRYRPTSSGIMEVRNCGLTSLDTEVTLYDQCSSSPLISNDNACSFQSSIKYPVLSGETYFILWENDFDARQNFNWEIKITPFVDGEDCSQPLTASEGINMSNHSNGLAQWFTYTATADKKITISSCGQTENTKLELYENCSERALASSDDFCGTQSLISYLVTSGTTYFIKWDNEFTDGSYNWTLNVNDIEVGDNCEMPIAATDGVNSADHSDGLSQWYSYSSQADGILTLSTCSQTTEDTQVRIYDSCNGSSLASNDNGCGVQSELVYSIKANTTYFIEWSALNKAGNYNWNLNFIDPSGGDTCDSPFEAVEGNNFANNQLGSEWYNFTLNTTSRVQISFCSSSEDTQFNIYLGCDQPPIFSADDECSGVGSKKAFIAQAGVEYLIEWTNNKTSGSYEWNFEIDDIEAGDICELPKDAVLGNNQSRNENGFTQWYTYTPPVEGQLTLTSCNLSDYDTKVTVLDACDGNELASNDDFCDIYSFLQLPVEEAVTYYIKWENLSPFNDGFNWDLSLGIELPGQNCTSALVASEGINTADNANGNQWFSYTPPNDGQLKVSTCGLTTEDTFFAIFGNCESSSTVFSDDACGLQSSIATFVEADSTYYIVWFDDFTDQSYSWNIELITPIAGEICTAPLKASIGLNDADHTNGTAQWYEYTAPRNGEITLSACDQTSEDTFVLVFDNCSGNIIATSELDCVNESDLTFPVKQDEKYLIEWSNRFTSAQYQWEMSISAPDFGEACEKPIVASEGINLAKNLGTLSNWYSFTTTNTGVITLSSCELTEYATTVRLYKACGDLIVESDQNCGIQTELTYYAEQGMSFVIEWIGDPQNNETAEFEWQLEFTEPSQGEICQNPTSAIEGINTSTFFNPGFLTNWFSYVSQIDGTIKVSSCELTSEDTYLRIYEQCNASVKAESDNECGLQSVLEYEVKAGVTYLIAWSGTTSTDTFDWELSFEEPSIVTGLEEEAKEFNIYPNPSDGVIFIDQQDHFNIEEIIIFDMLGKEVYSNTNTSSQLKLNFEKGIYSVRIRQKNGLTLISKLVIEN